jgi:hypothetical protein
LEVELAIGLEGLDYVGEIDVVERIWLGHHLAPAFLLLPRTRSACSAASRAR